MRLPPLVWESSWYLLENLAQVGAVSCLWRTFECEEVCLLLALCLDGCSRAKRRRTALWSGQRFVSRRRKMLRERMPCAACPHALSVCFPACPARAVKALGGASAREGGSGRVLGYRWDVQLVGSGEPGSQGMCGVAVRGVWSPPLLRGAPSRQASWQVTLLAHHLPEQLGLVK